MNRNPKEKSVQILIRAKSQDKDKIKNLADKCNLPVSEYVMQRALGYEPKAVLPDAFYNLYSKLCDVTNELKNTVSPETETKLIELVQCIQSDLLLPCKDSNDEIINEAEVWLQQDSGL